MELNLQQVLRQVIKITKRAYRQAIKKYQVNRVETKELNDIVSEVDQFMEQQIVNALRALYPDHSFVGEEYGTKQGSSAYDWLIDPIDGTINFVAGLPLYGTSVALRKNKETILGVIFDWPNRQICWAIKGQGAYQNHQRLHVSTTKDLKNSVLTFCLTSHYNQEHTDAILQVAHTLSPLVRGLRLIVCSVAELSWLAHGFTDGMLNVKPSLGLSSCAGKLIVTEAGGKVTNLQGQPQREKDTLLITNGIIHEQIVTALASIRH